MNQKEFENTIEEFQKIEDARDQLWDRARELIVKSFEVEAYILILATWNFAYFRYVMKSFDLHKFKEVINNINPVFEKLKNKKFENIDFDDNTLISKIKFVYIQLKDIAGQTGATKILALKNPNLFIMWDTEIRRIYQINNQSTADDYIKFLMRMDNDFKNIKWNKEEHSKAKAIDEYNYVIADGIRKTRSFKKKANRLKKWQMK